MGAYSNPEIIVDTQTGQHFRNLQESISGTIANVAQNYSIRQKEIQRKLEENQKKLEEINKETDEYSFALRTSVGKLKSSDDKINMAETFEPLIQQAVTLKSGLLNNTITGQDRQKAMQTLSDINATISGNFSNSLSELSVYANDVDGALIKPIGDPGGLAIDMDPSDVKALRIMQGKLGGTKKAVYKDADPNNLVWEIYDEGGNLVKEYAASKLKQIGDLGNEYVKIVPDRTKDNEKLKANSKTVFETKPVDPKDPSKGDQATDRIQDDFLEKNPDGSIKVEKKYLPESNVFKLVAKPDLAKIEASIAAQLDAQVAGMTDEELMLHTNNTVNKYRKQAGLKPIYFDSDSTLDSLEKAEAIAAYKNHFLNTQIKREQDILKEDSSVFLQEDPKPAKPKAVKPPKEKKPITLSQSQRALENIFETPLANREAEGVGEGVSISWAGQIYKFIGGKWFAMKENRPVGKPISELALKKKIGYAKKQ